MLPLVDFTQNMGLTKNKLPIFRSASILLAFYSIFQVNEVRAWGHGSANAPTINDYLYLTNLQFAVTLASETLALQIASVLALSPAWELIPRAKAQVY